LNAAWGKGEELKVHRSKFKVQREPQEKPQEENRTPKKKTEHLQKEPRKTARKARTFYEAKPKGAAPGVGKTSSLKG
jgi:hypothetical protein